MKSQSELTVYDYPELYDWAFSYRNYAREVDSLLVWYREVTDNKPLFSVLELASGPACHSRELSRRGVAAVALDRLIAMCEYAKRRASELGLALDAVRADMVGFHLGKRFNLAILMLDSASHIHTPHDMVRHLNCVADHITERGVYIVELALHDRDGENAGTKEQWTVKTNESTLFVDWVQNPRGTKRINSLHTTTATFRQVTPEQETTVTETMVLRSWTKRSFENAVAKTERFVVASTFGDFAVLDPAQEQRHWRLFYCLQANS